MVYYLSREGSTEPRSMTMTYDPNQQKPTSPNPQNPNQTQSQRDAAAAKAAADKAAADRKTRGPKRTQGGGYMPPLSKRSSDGSEEEGKEDCSEKGSED